MNFDDNNIRLVDLDGDGVIDALRTGASFELFFNDPIKGWQSVETRPRQPTRGIPQPEFFRPAGQAGRPDRRRPSGLRPRRAGPDRLLALSGLWPMGPARHHGQQPRLPRTPFPSRERLRSEARPVRRCGRRRTGRHRLCRTGPADVLDQPGRQRLERSDRHHGTPPLTDVDAVRLADMLGTGTAGVLWTFDQIGAAPRATYQFLDLTGGVKPYLLEQMDNHMGAVTRVAVCSVDAVLPGGR